MTYLQETIIVDVPKARSRSLIAQGVALQGERGVSQSNERFVGIDSERRAVYVRGHYRFRRRRIIWAGAKTNNRDRRGAHHPSAVIPSPKLSHP
jgi:hypothetical protein